MTARVWANGPAGHTPMTAAAMNGIEADLDARPAAWAPTTAYALGQQVVSPNNDVVSAIAAHTSGGSFNPANWNLSANLTAALGVPDAALAARVVTGATATALNATYVPKWKPLTAYAAGYAVLSPTGDIVTAATSFTSGASFNAADWLISTSYEQAGNAAAFAIVFGS